MILKSDEIIELLEKEIEWCKDNEPNHFLSDDKELDAKYNDTYRLGFIDGLLQARRIASGKNVRLVK